MLIYCILYFFFLLLGQITGWTVSSTVRPCLWASTGFLSHDFTPYTCTSSRSSSQMERKVGQIPLFFFTFNFFFLGFLILLIQSMLLTFILYIIKGQEWHLTFPLLPSLNSFPNEPNLHSLLHTTPCDSLSWWIQFESLLLVYSLHM